LQNEVITVIITLSESTEAAVVQSGTATEFWKQILRLWHLLLCEMWRCIDWQSLPTFRKKLLPPSAGWKTYFGLC